MPLTDCRIALEGYDFSKFMKARGAGNSDTLWKSREYLDSKSTTSFVLEFDVGYFTLAPFSILFLIDECLRGTSGGAELSATVGGAGVGGALTCDCEPTRCGGNGGADESETSRLFSMLLMLFEEPELGNLGRDTDRLCSIDERFKAFVDFA